MLHGAGPPRRGARSSISPRPIPREPGGRCEGARRISRHRRDPNVCWGTRGSVIHDQSGPVFLGVGLERIRDVVAELELERVMIEEGSGHARMPCDGVGRLARDSRESREIRALSWASGQFPANAANANAIFLSNQIGRVRGSDGEIRRSLAAGDRILTPSPGNARAEASGARRLQAHESPLPV